MRMTLVPKKVIDGSGHTLYNLYDVVYVSSDPVKDERMEKEAEDDDNSV